MGILAVLLSVPCGSYAAGIESLIDPKTRSSKYQRPEDLLDLIPFLGDIPRTFIVGDGFKMKLSGQELRIDHMGYRSKSRAEKRLCHVGLSYTTVVAGFFTSRVDLPLLHSESLSLSSWKVSSMGDYVAYFSRGVAKQPTLRLVASARF
jgi:hypothetical protein